MSLMTERLYLRQWKDSDYAPFAELNADPITMRFFPNTLSKKESDAIAEKFKSLIEKKGWGLWALSLKDTNTFIGFTGLYQSKDSLPFSPCVEIGWRLHRHYWGKGYATEAAKQALVYAFSSLNIDELVSFTAVNNQPSRALMERLHMTNTCHNFHHPDIPEKHPLAEHVLYKMTRSEWQERQTLINQ